MKYSFLLVILMAHGWIVAQEDISLNIEISADTILMDNAFKVEYTIHNGSADGGISIPELKGFQLLQGPSRSSQVSIINGVRSSKESYTYYYKPNEIGQYQLPQIEVELDGAIYKSNRPKIVVISNPDGLHQDPSSGWVEHIPKVIKQPNQRKRFKI